VRRGRGWREGVEGGEEVRSCRERVVKRGVVEGHVVRRGKVRWGMAREG
jgi:hypothetical protein